MANSRKILLKLVRMAMGWENDFSLPQDVDWIEVLNMASEQGVEAIVLDGYEEFMSKNPQQESPFKTTVKKKLMLEAIGQLNVIEFNNQHHLSSLLKLSDILSKKNIPFIVMKGFGCAQYYPKPEHRSCGDIDIYPGELFERSNQALQDAGVEIQPDYYRHTASFIDDVMIENHRILVDLRGPKKQTMDLENDLKKIAKKDLEADDNAMVFGTRISGAKFPSANFNALFLPWHVSAHFVFEKVTIRHLLDWALFLVHDGRNIDVKMFREAKAKYTYGYSKLADTLTNLSMRYLNMPTGDIPLEIIEDGFNFDNRLADKVFDYMFVGQSRERDEKVWKFRWNNVRRVWNERWKYRQFYGIGAMTFLFYKTKGALLHEGE